MSGPRTPRPLWQPTPGWQVKRVVAALLPVAFIGYFIADVTGNVDLPGWLGIGWFAVAAPIAIALAIRSRRAARSRRVGLQALATQPGWYFYPVDQRFTTRWSTSPFGAGSPRRAFDVLMGSYAGLPCAAFTYKYTTGSGDSQSTTVLGVTTLMLPAALPTLTVTPESLVGEIAPGIVRADIDVESETFNRRYRVRSAILRFASDVLTPRTIEVLLSVEPFSWRIEGRDLIAWGPPTDSVDAVMARLDVLSKIARNIPQFVWKEVARPADWHLRRILAAAIPVVIVGFIIADTTLDGVSPVWFFVLLGLVTVPVGVADILRVRRTRESRQAGFQALAAERGWSYSPAEPRFTTRWSTAPFGCGYSPRATDVVIGTYEGMPCAAFTYTVDTEDGETKGTTVLD